jgi:molybdate-binding protein
MVQDFERDLELNGLLDKLRSTMKDIRSQIDIIEATISSCEIVEKNNYENCIDAVSTAEVEAIHFVKLSAELVDILARLRVQVYARHL